MTASATVRWLGLGEEVGSARKVGQWRADRRGAGGGVCGDHLRGPRRYDMSPRGRRPPAAGARRRAWPAVRGRTDG